MAIQKAKFSIGDVVKHKHFDFRGVIYDVDFEFNNSEEWYQSIPKNVRPRKDQPFYHLLAENDEITYEAYVSEQNLLADDSDEPIKHPLINDILVKNARFPYFISLSILDQVLIKNIIKLLFLLYILKRC